MEPGGNDLRKGERGGRSHTPRLNCLKDLSYDRNPDGRGNGSETGREKGGHFVDSPGGGKEKPARRKATSGRGQAVSLPSGQTGGRSVN